MANNMEQKLLSEFPPVSTEQWEEVIAADLKGADYQKKLVWKTAEGFNVRPYYRAEDLKGIQYLGAGIGEFPYVRSTGKCNSWKIQQTIAVTDDASKANGEALKAIEGGADAMGFCVSAQSPDAAWLDNLLSGIDLSSIEVTFRGKSVREIALLAIAKADRDGICPEKSRINFTIDPIISKLSLQGAFGCCEDGSVCMGKIKELIEKGAKYKRWRFVGVGGYEFHNSGSTIVQELAFTLAAGHEYLVKLMEAGLDVDAAAKAIRFSMAVSANYFMEIAKFRAARMLWANIVSAYSPKCDCSQKMFIHAVTSKWNLTVYDPYVNMLRGTTEAMSASIAGVHSLEVLPFDAAYEAPTEFSSRIARNVQLLLKHESHFDSVVDPSGGSYYIENLTSSIAEQAWNLFREVEDKGGYIAAFKEGFIVDKVSEAASKKDQNLATRREILLGTNQYPNFTEVVPKEVSEKGKGCCCSGSDKGADAKVLRPYRGAMAFEELRMQVDRSSREPKAFMLTAGSLAMARARSQFSSNFFGCAGIRIIDNNFFSDIKDGIKAALDSKAEIVVLCAADDDYAELAPIVYEQLQGKAILVVAGAPACASELEAKGITNFINVRSNVLETLRGYVKELGI